MTNGGLYLQPSIRQLLAADALSEAQVLTGEEHLDQPCTQVVFGFSSARAGSLVVARAEVLADKDGASLKDLAGVIAVQSMVPAPPALASVGSSAVARKQVAPELDLDLLTKKFAAANVPLIVLPGLIEPGQIAEEIRLLFQSEIKRTAGRLHAHFVSVVIEEGVTGLCTEFEKLLNRPIAVENADFKLLAAENMGSTPANQQKTLTEEVAEELRREFRSKPDGWSTGLPEQPIRIGRRLVMPIMLDGIVVGYVSVMIRPTDDPQFIADYLNPAALAALVDFSARRKEVSTFSVTQKSLLKDLLSGETLSAGDQERVEQHYGFDLCDGFFVFVVHSPAREANWDIESLPVVEIEHRKVFVVPHDSKAPKTWQQHADELIKGVKGNNGEVKVQLASSRLASNILELPDAYREGRQALIIGTMMHHEKEFTVGYAELGIKRLLYLMLDHPELDRFYEENLAQLEAYDTEWETELVPTVRMYLEQGANLNSAAKELFIHRHTMRYRLEQIAELLNVDIDSQEVLLNLQIAFLIREMKGKSGS